MTATPFAYFDCFAGVAGDMVLGALLDAGGSAGTLRAGLAAVPLDPFELEVAAVERGGIGATQVTVRAGEPQAARTWGSLRGTLAGADLPVAEEAWVTAEAFGCRVDTLVDVGVAGAHRLFADAERLQAADVLVVVAGMEGTLPSLVAGMVAAPVIAVPTSVGYGAAFDGLAALLAMLTSCAVGVSVVNIDNGFGAGALAARILAGARRRPPP